MAKESKKIDLTETYKSLSQKKQADCSLEKFQKMGMLERFLYVNAGETVNDSDRKAAVDAFKKTSTERAKLEKALVDFDKKTSKVAEDLVRAFGNQILKIDGKRYAPTARGERIYYKTLGEREAVEL